MIDIKYAIGIFLISIISTNSELINDDDNDSLTSNSLHLKRARKHLDDQYKNILLQLKSPSWSPIGWDRLFDGQEFVEQTNGVHPTYLLPSEPKATALEYFFGPEMKYNPFYAKPKLKDKLSVPPIGVGSHLPNAKGTTHSGSNSGTSSPP